MAFRKLARKFHCDVSKQTDASEQMAEVNVVNADLLISRAFIERLTSGFLAHFVGRPSALVVDPRGVAGKQWIGDTVAVAFASPPHMEPFAHLLTYRLDYVGVRQY